MSDVAKLEKQIVATAIQSRSAWETLQTLEVGKDLGPEAQKILGVVGSYYGADSTACAVDQDIVSSTLIRGLGNPKHEELFREYLQRLPAEVSESNLLNEVAALKRQRAGQQLASALATGKSENEINQLIQEYQRYELPELLTSSGIEYKTGWDIADLMHNSFDPEKLIKLSPKTLTDRAEGGAMRGDHLLLFACTEIGKTLFAVNMAAGFVRQGLRTVYVGNEEPTARITLRLINRLSGVPKWDLYNEGKWDEIRSALDKNGYENFTAVDLAPGTLPELRTIVDDLGADVLVVDQLRNLEVNTDNRVNQLEQAATGVRNIAKGKNILCLSLTQAADSADGKAVLGRGDVDFSNVGIPGQADMMIALGATEDMEAKGLRCVSFPKNKNGSHEPFFVQIYPELSKVEEV